MCLHPRMAVPLAAEASPQAAWDGLDFDRPWLAPVAGQGPAVQDLLQRGWPVAEALNALGSLPRPSGVNGAPDPQAPVRFVPQATLPDGMAYERFIRQTAQVPTRDNLHDLFNGLVWQTFPQSKTELNRLHDSEISAHGVGQVRGAARDAATLFDENGAVLQAPDALWQALLARDWHRLFVTLRPLWRQARLTLFGHALMEQLVFPRKSITAHVLIESFAMDSSTVSDADLARCLTAGRLATKPFTPLPVLGIPGWWSANADPAFYADVRVFRPPRPAAGTVARLSAPTAPEPAVDKP